MGDEFYQKRRNQEIRKEIQETGTPTQEKENFTDGNKGNFCGDS